MPDDIKKIKDLVEIVVSKVRGMETQQSMMADQVRVVRDQQSVMNDKLDNISERIEGTETRLSSVDDKLDNHTAALIKIEETLEGYADMYKVNKEKNAELEERVETIEEKLVLSSKN